MASNRRIETETDTLTEPAPPAPDAVPVPSVVLVPDALRRAAEAVWVAGQRGAPWSTLALVPAEPRLRTDALARAVAELGSGQRGEPVEYLDLRSASIANSRALGERLADEDKPYRRVVALGCPTDDRVSELLATSAAAAVLVLEQDTTLVEAARRVVEIVGSERFLGAIVLEPAS